MMIASDVVMVLKVCIGMLLAVFVAEFFGKLSDIAIKEYRGVKELTKNNKQDI